MVHCSMYGHAKNVTFIIFLKCLGGKIYVAPFQAFGGAWPDCPPPDPPVRRARQPCCASSCSSPRMSGSASSWSGGRRSREAPPLPPECGRRAGRLRIAGAAVPFSHAVVNARSGLISFARGGRCCLLFAERLCYFMECV